MKKCFALTSTVIGSMALLFTLWSSVLAATVVTNNNGLTVNENSTGNIISQSDLLVEDDGGALPISITYTLKTTPAHGTVNLSGSSLSPFDEFTQQDINNSLLTYDHDGSETPLTDSFVFSIVNSINITNETFTITITPVNDPPTAAPDTIRVMEGMTVGLTITGNLLTYNDTDPENDPLVVTITPVTSPTQKSYFELGASGSFTYTHNDSENLSDAFDYEVCDPAPLCDIGHATVIITGVVDIAPTIDAPSAPFPIPENSITNTFVGTVTATDIEVDPGGYDTLIFSIIGGNTGNAFQMDPGSGDITVKTSSELDQETKSSYILLVKVEDEAGLNHSRQIAVDVINVNEKPVIPDNQTFSVPENSTAINPTQVIATDPENDTLFYEISAIDPVPPDNIFQINNLTGELSVIEINKFLLDYEGQDTYTLTVRVSDPMTNTTNTIRINVTNVNEPPAVNNQVMTVDENSINGSPVGSIAAPTDPDGETAFLYSIIGGDGASIFEIINPNNEQVTVADGSQLDFETKATFNIQVQVSDSGNLTDTADITININDVNEAPIITPDQTFLLPENSGVGVAVDNVEAIDVDANDAGLLQYEITGGNTNGAFNINSSGTINVANPGALNFEMSPNFFNLEITVTDSGWGDGPKQDVETVIVQLENVNEKPTFAPAQSFEVVGFSSDGTVVGTVSADDPDAGTSLSYTIVGGNTGSAFAIDINTGLITVNDGTRLDIDTNPEFTLVIRVKDNGSPTNLFVDGSVTITLIPPPIYYAMLPIILFDYPAIEPNNRCSEAFAISTNTTYSFEPNDAEDWYKFNLTTSGPVSIVLSNYIPVGQIIAYGGSCGSLVFLRNNGDFTPTKIINLTGLPPGTYYIRVVTDPPFSTILYNLRVNTP